MNPEARLLAAFQRIATTRMAGVALCNPALSVETVGFTSWQGLRAGVLITPWALNLVLLPDGSEAFRPQEVDERQSWRFPSGDYAFMGGAEPECGPFQFCSLFSPAFEFAAQQIARETAQAIMSELFRSPELATVETSSKSAEAAGSGLSRRAFLTGSRA